MNELWGEGQKSYTYKLTSSVIDGEDNLRYTTYGVAALDQSGEVLSAYPDVSADRLGLEELVVRCNERGLSILHLEDVLLDFIE
jgi:hypothetical protein